MRPITVTVGPLGAASGNLIASGQQPSRAGPQQLLLSGAAITQAWQGSCTILGSVLTVTGTTSGQIASGMLINGPACPPNLRIIGPGPVAGTWSVAPPVAGGLVTLNPGRGNPSVVLDAPRQVAITDTDAAGTVTFTIYGTDAAGSPISETLVSTGANLVTSQNFATVTQVTTSGPTAGTVFVGTAATATSAWVMFDPYVSGGYISKQAVVTGVANYTVQLSYDDPNAPGGPAPGAMGWLPDSDATFVGATTSLTGSWPYVPLWARVLLNSGTGSVRATFIQPGNLGR